MDINLICFASFAVVVGIIQRWADKHLFRHFGPKKKTLYIIRGLPGSGKSTLAKQLANQYGINYWEADMYFTDPDTGEYNFVGSKIGEAHEWCQGKVAIDVSCDHKSVIVSNTFTRYAEMRYYIELALAHHFKVKIIECTGEYGNIHGVPEEAYQKMKLRYVPNNCLGMGIDSKNIEFETI